MSTVSDGLSIAKWLTERIDQVSNFFKRKNRNDEVKRINDAIDSGNAARIADIVQKLRESREKRKNERP